MPNTTTSTLRKRFWFGTLNNPPASFYKTLENGQTQPFIESRPGMDYFMGQFEIGESGTEHLQFIIHFTTPKSLRQLILMFNGAHLEGVKGSPSEARAYCSKEDTRKPNSIPLEFGELPAQGKRNDLSDAAAIIRDTGDLTTIDPATFIRYHRGLQAYAALLYVVRTMEPIVLWIHGPTGTGKSFYASTLRTSTYWKPPGKWWDGYVQQLCVILDDYRGDWAEWGVFANLLRLLDRYPLRVESKGNTVEFNSELIVITSDRPPADVWFNQGDISQLLRRITRVIDTTGCWLPQPQV